MCPCKPSRMISFEGIPLRLHSPTPGLGPSLPMGTARKYPKTNQVKPLRFRSEGSEAGWPWGKRASHFLGLVEVKKEPFQKGGKKGAT